MPLIWERPVSSEYPKIWHTFSMLGEKCVIQDLPQSMAQEATQFMMKYYFKDEPLTVAYGLHENVSFLDYWELMYNWVIIKQKAVLVCVKEGSNEILGINMNYVTSTEDSYDRRDIWRDVYFIFHQLYRLCTNRKYAIHSLVDSQRNIKRYHDLAELIKEEVPLKADTTLIGGGLCVAPKYRGRGIGAQLLRTRKQFCEEFHIKLTMNIFTSDAGDRCAEKAGFKLERRLSYDTIRKRWPDLQIPHDIESNRISLRSMRIKNFKDAR